jgi:predicted amidohydrolase YtcJ
MDSENPAAEAIAVKDGLILSVGDRRSVLEARGPATEMIDAGGASVIPGFIEAHMHLFSGAAELAHLQLAGISGFDALQGAIRGYAVSNPDRKMLVGQGVDYTVLDGGERVTRHHLDRILPDRPFVMGAPDHHTMWANTKALEMAGILHGKALGPGNEIVMGDDGLAEGELREGEAFGPARSARGSASRPAANPILRRRRRNAPPTARSCGAALRGAPGTASPPSRTWTAISTSSSCSPRSKRKAVWPAA